MRGWLRGVLGLTVAVATALVTTGCTVEARAVAGVGVGMDGEPVGFLQVCSEHIDGATVYQTDQDHLGTWTVKPAAKGFATWSFAVGGDGWTVTEPFATLKPGQTYHLYGWTKDNSSSADSVVFSPTDLAAMKPGQVRYWSGRSDASGNNDLEVVTSVAQFQQHACDRYR
jgi:hypothetical protein